MTSTDPETEGSFKNLRKHGLLMFDEKLRRHDRGWPHAPAEAPVRTRKGGWRTVGIFHFRDDDGETDQSNKG